MATVNPATAKYGVIARLFELMNNISEDQLLPIIKELLQEDFTNHIFKLVIDMTDQQRNLLLEKLEAKIAKSERIDKRVHSRKPCLMPVNYKINGHTFIGYILDISALGVFIETSDYFIADQDIIIAFSVPNLKKTLKLAAEIVWSNEQGIGVKFTHLTQQQFNAIKYFTESKGEVYEINS